MASRVEDAVKTTDPQASNLHDPCSRNLTYIGDGPRNCLAPSILQEEALSTLILGCATRRSSISQGLASQEGCSRSLPAGKGVEPKNGYALPQDPCKLLTICKVCYSSQYKVAANWLEQCPGAVFSHVCSRDQTIASSKDSGISGDAHCGKPSPDS